MPQDAVQSQTGVKMPSWMPQAAAPRHTSEAALPGTQRCNRAPNAVPHKTVHRMFVPEKHAALLP